MGAVWWAAVSQAVRVPTKPKVSVLAYDAIQWLRALLPTPSTTTPKPQLPDRAELSLKTASLRLLPLTLKRECELTYGEQNQGQLPCLMEGGLVLIRQLQDEAKLSLIARESKDI